ncbi:MAG: hypothetical protein HYX77_05640 [Acidobacteria bacterium]|nr:hypothetical protein [Acidobacteriota bacterium]
MLIAELKRRLGEIPTDREVVTYCRGSYCVIAIDAVQMLRDHGFRALRLDESLWQWKQRGFEVVEGEASS